MEEAAAATVDPPVVVEAVEVAVMVSLDRFFRGHYIYISVY
jgi:hypothetical protein